MESISAVIAEIKELKSLRKSLPPSPFRKEKVDDRLNKLYFKLKGLKIKKGLIKTKNVQGN